MKHIKLFNELNWFGKKEEEVPKMNTESDNNVRSAFDSIKTNFKPEKLSFKGNNDSDDEEWYKEFTYKISETYKLVLSKANDFQLFNFKNPNRINYNVTIGSKTVECSDTLCEEIFKFFKTEYQKKNRKNKGGV